MNRAWAARGFYSLPVTVALTLTACGDSDSMVAIVTGVKTAYGLSERGRVASLDASYEHALGTISIYRPRGEFTSLYGGDGMPCGRTIDGDLRCWSGGGEWELAASVPKSASLSVASGGVCALLTDGSFTWTRVVDDQSKPTPPALVKLSDGPWLDVSCWGWNVQALGLDEGGDVWVSAGEINATPLGGGPFVEVLGGCALSEEGFAVCPWLDGDTWEHSQYGGEGQAGPWVQLLSDSPRCGLLADGTSDCINEDVPSDLVAIDRQGTQTCTLDAAGVATCETLYDGEGPDSDWVGG
jgi:hypothetical protein